MMRVSRKDRSHAVPSRQGEEVLALEELTPLSEIFDALDTLAAKWGGPKCADYLQQHTATRKLPPEEQRAAVKEFGENAIRADARATMDALFADFDWEVATQECVEMLRREHQRLKVPTRATRRRFWFSNPRLDDEHRIILALAEKGMKLGAIGKALPRPRNSSMMGLLTKQIVWEHLCRGEPPPVFLLHPRRHVNARFSEHDAVWIATGFAHLIPKVDKVIESARRGLEREAA